MMLIGLLLRFFKPIFLFMLFWLLKGTLFDPWAVSRGYDTGTVSTMAVVGTIALVVFIKVRKRYRHVSWGRYTANFVAGIFMLLLVSGTAGIFGPLLSNIHPIFALIAGVAIPWWMWTALRDGKFARFDVLRWTKKGSNFAPVAEGTGGFLRFAGLKKKDEDVIGRASHEGTGKYGTAAFGTGKNLLRDEGLVVGRQLEGRKLLRWMGDGHLVTAAPTGSGKGVGAVIPNLLVYPGSVLVNDLKGENYLVTAARRRDMGQSVAGLDPFGEAGGEARYNPLDLIDHTSDLAGADARMMADMMCVSEAGSKSSGSEFFEEKAKALLTGLILHVCSTEVADKRSLSRVRELVTMGEAETSLLWQEMSESTACHGVVARTANMIMGDDPKTAKGVTSSVQRHLNWLDDVPMRRVTSTSTFDLNELKRGHLSVYTILPPAYLQSHRAWMRLMMGCSLLVMTRHKGRPASGYDTLFLMDEFAQLGRIERIVSDYTLLRGYGVKFWMVVQDFSQLEAAYGDVWTAFVSNAGALQVFQVNDNKTAKYLEERFGDMTIMTETENEGSSGKAFDILKNANDGFSRGEAGRKLMFASEIMQMPRDQQLIMIQGQQPVKARKVKYYEDAEFEGLYTSNTIDAKASA